MSSKIQYTVGNWLGISLAVFVVLLVLSLILMKIYPRRYSGFGAFVFALLSVGCLLGALIFTDDGDGAFQHEVGSTLIARYDAHSDSVDNLPIKGETTDLTLTIHGVQNICAVTAHTAAKLDVLCGSTPLSPVN